MNRCLCKNMFNYGGCKVFNCQYLHSKEDIKEQDISYCFHNDERFIIGNDRQGNQYYIPWNVFTKYAEKHSLDFNNLKNYTYKCYYDIKSKDERQNRYKVIHVVEILSNTYYSDNLKVKRTIKKKKLDNDLDNFKNPSNKTIENLSNEFNQLKKFVNEISIENSKMYRDKSNILNVLKTQIEQYNEQIIKANFEISNLNKKIKEQGKLINDLNSTLKNLDSKKSTNTYNLRKKRKL